MEYKFTPLPAAYPMKWKELLSPVRKAVCNLLALIAGAEESIKSLKDKKELGNCFLVYGSRGTGKTTVLLSAQEAINNKDRNDFFEKQFAGENEDILKDAAKTSVEKLKSIEWLDVLDLEPLPEEANLLATLLTRVRNAIGSDDNELTSILEEDSESARQQLTRLIHDATFMWENIREEDTRSIASRQVAAAEIYAEFRTRFNKAMDALTKELGRRSGAHSESRSIVLPIDNIDRSTYHLEAIVKLAQLVSHHRLWLVMAGDRVEVETFLERAYWKELIHSRVGIDTRGKESAVGEDETLVMARRQAAATSKKLWPSSHRIEIDFVAPEETLEFCPPDAKEHDVTIRKLLAEVVILHSGFEENDKDKNIRLIDLLEICDKIRPEFSEDDVYDLIPFLGKLEGFLGEHIKLSGNNEQRSLVEVLNKIIRGSDFRKRVDGNKEIESKLTKQTQEWSKQLQEGIMPGLNRMILEDLFPEHIIKKQPGIRKPCFLTRAAQHGLSLSARGVLDLWQLTYWVVNDKKVVESNLAAEKIARTMLRNAIAGSTMPSAMGKCLQERIIQRTEKGGTSLLFYEQTAILGKLYLYDLQCKLEGGHDMEDEKCSWLSRFDITVNKIENVMLTLRLRKKKGKKDNQPIELPDFVTAWLSILHDIIVLGYQTTDQRNPGSIVVLGDFHPKDPLFVEISTNGYFRKTSNGNANSKLTKLYKSKEIRWPMPKWEIFWVREIFQQYWENFLLVNKKKFSGVQCNVADEDLLLLATGWINCVLSTYQALRFQRDQVPKVDEIEGLDDWGRAMHKATHFYTKVQQDLKRPNKDVRWYDELAYALKEWMEKDLPLFISYLYVPYDLSSKDGIKVRMKPIEKIEEPGPHDLEAV